ncbi:MAG: ATP-binding protein [Acidobacteriota bacterium]
MKVSLRVKLLTYLAVLHVVLAVLVFFTLRDRPIWLFVAELVFACSLALGVWLVRGLFLPLQLVRTGTAMLADGDFTTEFREVGQPELDHLLQVYNTMVRRLREERLHVQEQNELLDRVIEASPGGVIVCDLDGRIASANPGACKILDRTRIELVGKDPAELPQLQGILGRELGTSLVVPTGSGRQVRVTRSQFRDRGFARMLLVVEELTEELRRSEKEAYGKLIRMISHEVNNSVGPVASLVDSVRSHGASLEPAPRERFEKGLDIATTRLDQLRSFVEGFADVVRLPEPKKTACDLDRILDDVLVLMSSFFDEQRVELVELEEGDVTPLGTVQVDKNQVEQVLINIFKNCCEATGEGGKVILRRRRVREIRRVEILDDGPGLSPDVQRNLFRPFYTTKDQGRGIGLTVIGEILHGHGFAHVFENRPPPDSGTIFRIDFR